jgi:hypothetical protein
MKTAGMIFALALVGSQALAQEQTRIYGPNGRSLGTAAPYGIGSVRYRDSRTPRVSIPNRSISPRLSPRKLREGTTVAASTRAGSTPMPTT